MILEAIGGALPTGLIVWIGLIAAQTGLAKCGLWTPVELWRLFLIAWAAMALPGILFGPAFESVSGKLSLGLCLLGFAVGIVAQLSSRRGRPLEVPASTEEDLPGKRHGSTATGTVCIVLAVLLFAWIQSHAPGNLSVLFTGGWVLKREAYYFALVIACLLGVYGVTNLVRALRAEK